ncbi:HEAT repeat domain-containing protein [Methyloglobulus sp.]|uniref:HEAT repeat domain-containing protein n=1 Tax=Methyloglobulus sp. TaxID=2518622 RepID=UPI0032B85D51
MTIDFSQSVRNGVFVLLIGYAGLNAAQIPVKTSTNALADLVVNDEKNGDLQLKVRQMPLAKVLDSIANKTHIPLHYSLLPEDLVTATCVGTTLKQVLECLLDRKADLILRYPHAQSKTANNGQIAEAWILGSRLDDTAAENFPAPEVEGSFDLFQNQQNTKTEQDRIDELLKMAQSENPEERAAAIGALLTEGREDDPDVKAALERALTDQESIVRSQAVSSYAHRENSAAVSEVIQEALNDSSADVRMMAVDSITDDVALLQEAVNDSDATIRSLAAIKLEELTAAVK